MFIVVFLRIVDVFDKVRDFLYWLVFLLQMTHKSGQNKPLRNVRCMQ
jgi:hypothetical protein